MIPKPPGQALLKFFRGTASPEELQALNSWYAHLGSGNTRIPAPLQDPAQKALLKSRLRQRIWQRIQEEEAPPKRAMLQSPFFRIAASVTAFLLLASLCYLWLSKQHLPQRSMAFQEILHEGAGVQLLTLADGSEVHLHPHSRLRLHPDFPEKREIHLQGQAFFSVSHLPDSPFQVHTEQTVTEVLGTRFSVTSFSPDEAEIAVASGRVQVRHLLEEQQVVLSAQEALRVSATSWEPYQLSPEDQTFSWLTNELHFQDAGPEELSRVLQRWYGLTVQLVPAPDASPCRLSGTFRALTVEEFLETLAFMLSLDYQLDGEQLILDFSSCP